MTDYDVDVVRDTATGDVIKVTVRDGSFVVGGWERPHPDVWAASFSEKDEVRRRVDAAGARRKG